MLKTLLAILLFAAPVLAQAQDQATQGLPETGCGPDKIEFDVKTDKKQHPAGQMEPGKALVYVFDDEKRDAHEAYLGDITVKVGVDGAWIGATRYQSYFFFPVSVGDHRLCAGWQSKLQKFEKIRTAASFSAGAEEVHYFRVVSDLRNNRQPTIRIEPVDEAEGALLITSLALSTSKTKK
ncbi:MAG: hypothetical protein WBE13_00695 [Candidatus Acidiferrum sp.]